MKKNLLAIAIGAAVAMPTLALAGGPTVYGKVNVSLEQVEEDLDAGTEDADSQWQLDSNASRLGVKGDFDLDVANLKAVYKAEYEIAVDDGDSVFKQRDIFGGLEGGFGQLIAGNFDTPVKKAQGKIDQFNDLDGDIKHILTGETRSDNIIQYTTPKLAELVTIKAAFRPGEGDDLDVDGEAEDGLADTIYAAAEIETGGFFGSLSMAQNDTDSLEIDAQSGSALDIVRLVGAFSTDMFEVGAMYQIAEEAEANAAGDTGEESSIVLSGAVKVDRLKFKAQYGMTEADVNEDLELTLIGLGVDYKLAKASKVYTYFSEVEGDDGTDTLSDTTFGIGMEHKF